MKVKKLDVTIDIESGEILYKTEKDMDFYLYNAKGYLLFNNKASVKVYQRADWSIVTDSEKGKLMTLLPFLDDHNRFMTKGKPLAAKQISEILQISLPRSYSLLKNLVKINLIRKHDSAYYVNPNYLMCGSRLSKDTYMVFQDQLGKSIPDWVKAKYEGE